MKPTGLKRNGLEKFYTNQSVVDICINMIKQELSFNPNSTIIEPSAGNGAFIDSINSFNTQTLFIDIEPNDDRIQKQDYLTFEPDIEMQYHIVGNPPFGKNSSLARKFIKKSCEFSDTISFILPKSFKKPSMRKAFDLYFHLIRQIDLPGNSFSIGHEIYKIGRAHV